MTTKDKRNEYQRRYRASAKGKAFAKKWQNSDSFKRSQAKWLSNPINKLKHKQANISWKQSESGRIKEHIRTTSPEFKAKQKAYRSSDLGIETRKRYRYSINNKYNEYLRNAKSRGYIFNLTKEEFKSFWKQPCHYCGSPIEYIGLDRKDNSIGYTVGNIVPCCYICNRSKMDMSVKDYIAHCKLVSIRSQT
jgi:hypothetical protein